MKKKSRKMSNKRGKLVFADNLYTIADFAKNVLRNVWMPKNIWAESLKLEQIAACLLLPQHLLRLKPQEHIPQNPLCNQLSFDFSGFPF
jgi:hypothetical protein